MYETSIIPLALTVMMGPQIIVALLLVTHPKPIKSSLVYILSILITLVVTTAIYYYLFDLLDFKEQSGAGNHSLIKSMIVLLIGYLLIRTFLRRKKLTEKPKWMTSIVSASPWKISKMGFLLIALMPTEIAMEITVAGMIVEHQGTLLDAMGFFSMVTFIAALPILIYWLLGSYGNKVIDSVNNWLNTHGWVVNSVVYLFFVYLLLN